MAKQKANKQGICIIFWRCFPFIGFIYLLGRIASSQKNFLLTAQQLDLDLSVRYIKVLCSFINFKNFFPLLSKLMFLKIFFPYVCMNIFKENFSTFSNAAGSYVVLLNLCTINAKWGVASIRSGYYGRISTLAIKIKSNECPFNYPTAWLKFALRGSEFKLFQSQDK